MDPLLIDVALATVTLSAAALGTLALPWTGDELTAATRAFTSVARWIRGHRAVAAPQPASRRARPDALAA